MTVKSSVLVIDDESSIRRLLKVSLGSHDYDVIEATTGLEGLALAAQWAPTCILLDLGLPDLDGIEVLRRLRDWFQRSIIILSVRSDEEQIISALDNGADDYLTKPFNTGELLARLRASCRHYAKESQGEPVFVSGALKVDLSTRQVFIKGTEIRLTNTEYDVLKFFVKYAGRAVTHRQLLKEVWGPNAGEQNQYVRVYVNHLRQKIEETPQIPRLIVTEPGVGYRFKILPAID